jgi:hypothetical protein
MIWILLLYVLPFLLSCILGYKLSKGTSTTREQFLLFVLGMLVPLLNILFVMFLISESKTIKNIKEYLKQPL